MSSVETEGPPSGFTPEYLIHEIEVKRLFGRFDHLIRLSDDTPPRLILLYAENGRGKSTVLQMIWHLLSPAPNRNHRTSLLRVPFREVSVRLYNGDSIEARRGEDLVGPYTVSVRRKRRSILSVQYPGKNHEVEIGLQPQLFEEISLEDYERLRSKHRNSDKYTDYLQSLNVLPFFLADDRQVHDDNLGEGRTVELARSRAERRQSRSEPTSLQLELDIAIERVNSWIRSQLVSAQNAGSSSTDDIYAQVIEQLAKQESREDQPDYRRLRERVVEINNMTARFAEFGLMPVAGSKRLLASLDKMSSSALLQADSILEPYLEGQYSRLTSLATAEHVARTLVDRLNEFLVDKTATYNVRSGLRISTREGTRLTPESLSSGERQLTLLLCNAVLARDATGLFLIDEPELSLNPKWQRRLVQALLDCVEGANVQFIMATHSIEIVTKHRINLVQLGD